MTKTTKTKTKTVQARIPVPEIIEFGLKAERGLGVRSFLLSGPAGTGKTSLAHQVAQDLKATFVFIQCCPGMSETELIYTVLPTGDPDSKSGVKIIEGKLVEAIRASCKGSTVLVLDEWDKTRPTADAFLLDFLQNARVSWRIDGESMIEGNPDNLLVFLTSNAERDFSEPLLRRFMCVEMNHMNAPEMRAALVGYGCCDDHLPVLVQLYEDTINAGLDKPATVQELVDLERMIHAMGNRADFYSLVFSCVVKTRDAMNMLEDHVHRRPSLPSPSPQVVDDFVNAYETPSQNDIPIPASNTSNPRMPTLHVKKAESTKILPVEISPDEEVFAILPDYDLKVTTKVVKEMNVELSPDPQKVGGFEISTDDKERVLVSRQQPFSVDEALNMMTRGAEIYVECPFPVNMFGIKEIVKISSSISSWTTAEVAGVIDDDRSNKITWKITNPLSPDSILNAVITSNPFDDLKTIQQVLNDEIFNLENFRFAEKIVKMGVSPLNLNYKKGIIYDSDELIDDFTMIDAIDDDDVNRGGNNILLKMEDGKIVARLGYRFYDFVHENYKNDFKISDLPAAAEAFKKMK